MTARTSKGRDASLAPPAPIEVALPRDVQAPAIARAAVSARCAEIELTGSARRTLVLLVSEVVSNAVLHSSGPRDTPIVLSLEFPAGTIRVTVTDFGAGFTPRQRDPSNIHEGYGLHLLERTAGSWGVDADAPTRVWFELPCGP